ARVGWRIGLPQTLSGIGCSHIAAPHPRKALCRYARPRRLGERVLSAAMETDQYAPGPTVAAMRSAFLEGGSYAKLTHYGTITDSETDKEVDGHQLWSKRRVQIMVDIDNYLRSTGLPT